MQTKKAYTSLEIRKLRSAVRKAAAVSYQKGNITALREWMVVDMLSYTGMRVHEVVSLRCKHVYSAVGADEIYVPCAKADDRVIKVPIVLKEHIEAHIHWKQQISEGVAPEDFFFVGQRGQWTEQAVQHIVKKYLKQLNLYVPEKAVHALRHSYAVALFNHTHSIEFIKRQLGHKKVNYTMEYLTESGVDKNVTDSVQYMNMY